MKHIQFFILALIFSTLTACGGGSDGFGGGTSTPPAEETPPPGSSETPPQPEAPPQISDDHTINISIPEANAITQLEDEASGIYSYVGSLTVTDRNGDPVPAGTTVHLDIIDTIKARGFLDSISGNTLNDNNPSLVNGALGFNEAYIMRNGMAHFIGANDLVLLTNNADYLDQNRFIADPAVIADAVLANSIQVTTAYSQVYPTGPYTAGSTSYVIGSSEMGIKIHGIDPSDATITYPALTITDTNGVGRFRIEYPAKASTIHLGCGITAIDERFLQADEVTPDRAGDVYMVARLEANDAVTAVVSEGVCYHSIAPWTLTAIPQAVIAGNGTFNRTIIAEDAGLINLPYISIGAMAAVTTRTVTDPGPPEILSPITITATGCTTSFNGSGECVAQIVVSGGVSGDAGEVTFYNGTTTTETIQISIP